ncbi:thiaminase II [Ammoniphilus sp. 3BR4]|uniref:thiaminase II n=1 Tax=Ammoniphilus sp. 3BR4 TaxID=3158265 RepID=UPI0034675826
MKFSERLYEKVRPVWGKTHAHPFVRGLGDGSLPRESFEYYMKQDYVYLIDYAKMFALGSMKARDLDSMAWFAKLLHETLHGEMELHRQYAERFGITRQELEDTKATPINLAYTRYMLHVAQNGSLEELISALLPCMWSYWEIGKALADEFPESKDHSLYGEWVTMYSSAEFGSLAQWLIGHLDDLTEGKPERELAILEEHFLNTSRFEYMFWDMAYHRLDWPVE